MEITGTTTAYGNLQLGIDPAVYNVLYAKSKVGAIAIPYVTSNGTDWAVNIRAAGTFGAQLNYETTVVVGLAAK